MGRTYKQISSELMTAPVALLVMANLLLDKTNRLPDFHPAVTPPGFQ
jgi:hypothetical protein